MSAGKGGAGVGLCDVCGRRYSWGCGHTPSDEAKARRHNLSTDHLLGDCDCFVSRAGYAARFTREQRRDNIAHVLRLIMDAATTTGDPDMLPSTKAHLGLLYDELHRGTS